jgi:hypothetical protein
MERSEEKCIQLWQGDQIEQIFANWVIRLPVGFCYRQVAILLLGITIIISHLITGTPEPIP